MEETAIPPRPKAEPPPLRGEHVPNQSVAEVRTGPNSILGLSAALAAEILCDDQGPIPKFPVRRAFDEQGRYIPMSPEEREAREDAYRRSMKVIDAMDQDPPGSDGEFMRGIDSHRPEGSKLFEGYS